MSVIAYPERGGLGGTQSLVAIPETFAGPLVVVNGSVYVWNGTRYVLEGFDKFSPEHDFRYGISIHDYDLSRGQALTITSPYSTGDLPSNSLVHPTVIRSERGIDGSPYIMAVTPFAGADDTTENPCIFVSDDLLTWRTPTGVTNPVFDTPVTGYNSDTHIYEHTDGYFYMLWRRYVSGGNAYVYGARSEDGITWEPQVTLFEDVAATQDWASPSFHHDGTRWIIFAHNIASANALRKFQKVTNPGALLESWMAVSPSTVTPTHPNSLSWWHSDIRRLPSGRLISLALAGGAVRRQAGGPGGSSPVWLWQSDNAGANWSLRQIARGRVNYRSSLVIDGDDLGAIIVWTDSTAAGTPTYTEMRLHRLQPGRLERRRVQANLLAAITPTISLNIEDEANIIVHGDNFAGTAADLAAPWVQLTATAMRRNGSGVAVAANTTNPAFVVADMGAPDHWARMKLAAYSSGTAELILKGVDTSNYLAIGVVDGSGKLSIKGYVGGVATLDEMQLLTPSLAAGIVIRAHVDGLLLRVWADGVLVWERDIPAGLVAGTYAGLRTSGTVSNQFDEFVSGRL